MLEVGRVSIFPRQIFHWISSNFNFEFLEVYSSLIEKWSGWFGYQFCIFLHYILQKCIFLRYIFKIVLFNLREEKPQVVWMPILYFSPLYFSHFFPIYFFSTILFSDILFHYIYTFQNCYIFIERRIREATGGWNANFWHGWIIFCQPSSYKLKSKFLRFFQKNIYFFALFLTNKKFKFLMNCFKKSEVLKILLIFFW